MIGQIIYGAKTKTEILKRLKDAGFQYDDLSKEYGYMNIHIPFLDGYYRIYKPKGRGSEIKTQVWKKTTFRYSGIPTFEPSGRKSF